MLKEVKYLNLQCLVVTKSSHIPYLNKPAAETTHRSKTISDSFVLTFWSCKKAKVNSKMYDVTY